MGAGSNVTEAYRRFRSMGLTVSTTKRIANTLPTLPPGTGIDIVVGANIRRLALSCGMSHIEVAAALGLKPRELSAIERGEIRAGGKLVICAAKLFGVQPSTFFDVASIKQASDGASQRPRQRAQRANRRPNSVLRCKANRRIP